MCQLYCNAFWVVQCKSSYHDVEIHFKAILKKYFSTTKQRTLPKETISKPHQQTMSGNNLNHFLYELHAQKKLIWNVWVSWSSWQCLGNMSKLLLSIKPTICCLKPRLLTKKTGYTQYTENDLVTLNNTTNNEGSEAFNPGVFSLLLSAVSRNENCTGQLPKCFQLREPE